MKVYNYYTPEFREIELNWQNGSANAEGSQFYYCENAYRFRKTDDNKVFGRRELENQLRESDNFY